MATTRPGPSDVLARLPDGLALGPVTLVVGDRERSLAFYRDFLGFRVLAEEAGRTTVGADGPLLHLEVRPGAARAPRDAPGLYHVAIRLPERAHLAHSLRRLVDAGYPFGASDHLVSEALYLDDPDGNGLEIYHDRPRGAWRWNGDQVEMATIRLDGPGLLAELDGAPGWDGLPAGTDVGHVHLRIGDADMSEAFYHGTMGFDVTARVPGARFLSAGGYHHHVGANAWESKGALSSPEGTAGLVSWGMILPASDDVAALRGRLESAGVTTERIDGGFAARDPWGIRFEAIGDRR